MSLELPPLVFFLFFLTPRGAEQLLFCHDFHPFSEVGNSRLHSTLFNYSRFYGILEGRKTPLQQEFCHYVFFAFLKRCLEHGCQGLGLLTSSFDLCTGAS